MFLKHLNQNRAIGAFVFVMAFDAVATCNGNPPWMYAVLLAVINFPGILLVIALSFLLGHFGIGNDADSGLFKSVVAVAALYSAGFWSLMFSYVFGAKNCLTHSPEPAAVDAFSSAARSSAQVGGGSLLGL
jgi:hypothetical protein